MFRRTTAALAAAAAVTAFAACGSEGSSGVKPETAKTSIERAAKIQLTAESLPAEARDEGLVAAYSNTATAVKDKQVVGLFVMKSEKVAGKVGDLVRGTAPQGAKLYVHDEVMVVYAPAGKDRGSAVTRAVKAL